MRFIIRYIITIIAGFTVTAGFLLASKDSVTAALSDEFFESKTKLSANTDAGFTNTETETKTDTVFFSDHSLFSADADLYLGQKQRRRGGAGGRVWGNLYYADSALKPKDFGYKIKPEFYGLQLGFDLVQQRGEFTTFYCNVNKSDADYGSMVKTKGDNYLLGIGKCYSWKVAYITGIYSFGYDQYKVNDRSTNRAYKGNGMQMNLFGEFGVNFIFGKDDSWAIKPFYALQYDFLYHGRIGDPGAVFQGDWNGHGFVQMMGTRINWKPFEIMEIHSRFTWVHEMLDKPPAFYHARFSAAQGIATPAVFYYQGNIGRDWAWIGCGLKFEAVFNALLFLDYDLTTNKRNTTHLVSLGLCFGW